MGGATAAAHSGDMRLRLAVQCRRCPSSFSNHTPLRWWSSTATTSSTSSAAPTSCTASTPRQGSASCSAAPASLASRTVRVPPRGSTTPRPSQSLVDASSSATRAASFCAASTSRTVRVRVRAWCSARGACTVTTRVSVSVRHCAATVSTVAGSGSSSYVDDVGLRAGFSSILSLHSVDAAGMLLLGETGRVRSVRLADSTCRVLLSHR